MHARTRRKWHDGAMVVSALPVVGSIVVWAIALGGLGIFIWRRIQGVPLRSKPPSDPTPDPSAAPPFPFPGAPGVTGLPGSIGTGPATPPMMAGLPPATALPPVPPVTAEGLEPVAPPEPSATRGGFFAAGPADPARSPAPPPSAGRPTVAEAVQGIVMPCGLSPVVDATQALPNPFRVSFLTNLAPAAEVGRALADELERLGYTLATTTPTELLARRDATELRVVLFPTAAAAKRGLDQLFPAAGPGSVGLELST